MNRMATTIIRRIRKRGFRVLFQCNFDASIAAAAIAPDGEAFIVQGKLCDDSCLIAELGKMVGLDAEVVKP